MRRIAKWLAIGAVVGIMLGAIFSFEEPAKMVVWMQLWGIVGLVAGGIGGIVATSLKAGVKTSVLIRR